MIKYKTGSSYTDLKTIAKNDPLIKKIQNSKQSKGNYIFYDENNNKYYYDCLAHKLIVGATGTGKTSSFIIPNIFNCIENNKNYVCISQSEDIIGYTYDYALKNGYDIKQLNLTHLECSDCFNPLLNAYYQYKIGTKESEHKANNIIKCIVKQLFNNNSKNADPFWEQGSITIVEGMIQLLFSVAENDKMVNMYSINKILADGNSRMMGTILLEKFIEQLLNNGYEVNCKEKLSTYYSGAGETRGSFQSVINEGISFFTDSSLMKYIFSSKNDFNFDKLVNENNKIAYYVVTPFSNKDYTKAIGIFIETMLNELIENVCDINLPNKKIIIFADECQTYFNPDIANYLSQIRKYNIEFCLALQSPSQLISKFGKDVYRTITANCDVKIYYGIDDIEEAKRISNSVGNKIIFYNDKKVEYPLIKPASLINLPNKLVFVNIHNYNFFSKIHPYYELKKYKNIKFIKSEFRKNNNYEINNDYYFDIKKSYSYFINHKMEQIFNQKPIIENNSNENYVDELLNKIDKKIAQLEESEKDNHD